MSQLITDTNAMKNQLRQEQLNALKQKEVYQEEARKEREELKSLLAVKDTSLREMTKKLEAATELEAQVASLQQKLATFEIKPSILEQSVEGRREDVTKSLADKNESRPEAKAELVKDEVNKSDHLAKEARKWSHEGSKVVMRADVVEKELAEEDDCADIEEAEEDDDEKEQDIVYSSANKEMTKAQQAVMLSESKQVISDSLKKSKEEDAKFMYDEQIRKEQAEKVSCIQIHIY